ncbi:hypothetical protein FOB64_006503 [Candida albicans]|uniref:CENP-T/Histone H4 histone fold domain-containing protein n=1 Tax=Candida albicans TaxID=5476 RepID=A0A8H6BUF6_CANAX|nr:hypothetical protein FOB64_006503 [Candida albicans]
MSYHRSRRMNQTHHYRYKKSLSISNIPSNNDIFWNLWMKQTDVNDVVLQEQHSHIDEMPQHERSPEKPKPLSYLQKILLAKSKKSSLISRKHSTQTPTKEVVPKLDDLKQSEENDASTVDTGKQDSQFEQDNGEIIDKIDHFAIQDNSKISNSIFPDWRDNSESADILNDLESAEDNQTTVVGDSIKDFEPDKEDRVPVTTSSTESNGQQTETVELAKSQSDELNTKENENEGSNEIDWNIQEPDFALMDDEVPSQEPTPTNEIEEMNEPHESSSHEDDITPPLTNTQEGGSLSMAKDQVTPENLERNYSRRIFVDNDQSASIFEGIDDDIEEDESTDDNDQEFGLEPGKSNRVHLTRIIPQKRKQSPVSSTGVDVSIRDVSYIVKSIQAHKSLNTNLPSRKKFKKPKSLSREIVKSIQEKSNEFLDTLMDDLKSYAEHRQSQTVDMKDVLLYLQRINFAGKGSSTNETEIDRISELAQKFLPLENLIALDNDLYDTISPQKKRQK